MECVVPEFVFDRSYTPHYLPVDNNLYISDTENTGYTCQYVNLAHKNTYAHYNLSNPLYPFASPALYNSGSFQHANGSWTLMYIRNCEKYSGPVHGSDYTCMNAPWHGAEMYSEIILPCAYQVRIIQRK